MHASVETSPAGDRWTLAAAVVALIGTAGSLYLSLGEGLKACPLCFYQRTFIMSVLCVTGIGYLFARERGAVLCLVSVPMAVAGLGVAAFHEYLVLTEALECPAGIAGVGTAPAQSLAVFIVLTAVLILGASQFSRPFAWVASAALGAVLAVGSVASAPPAPPAPSEPYDPERQPLEMCRPPYRPAEE